MGSEWDDIASAQLEDCIGVFKTTGPVYYIGESGHPVELSKAIFDERFEPVDGATEAGVMSTGPWLGVKLSDLPDDPEEIGPTIILGELDSATARRFEIREVQRDGAGGAKILLKECD